MTSMQATPSANVGTGTALGGGLPSMAACNASHKRM
jgi:hypothetical protein